MSIQSILDEYKPDLDAVTSLSDEMYQKFFEDNFSQIQQMYRRMKSVKSPITDEELEYILTMFPLELFEVSESLNTIKLNLEVIKLKNKEALIDAKNRLREEANSLGLNKTDSTAYISENLPARTVDQDLILKVYDSVISRVESERTFSRELIMGAKKVWDSRRSAEESMPIDAVSGMDDLPDYRDTQGRSYIR